MIPASQPPAPAAQYAAAPGAAPGGYTGMPGTPTQQQTPQQVSFVIKQVTNTYCDLYNNQYFDAWKSFMDMKVYYVAQCFDAICSWNALMAETPTLQLGKWGLFNQYLSNQKIHS